MALKITEAQLRNLIKETIENTIESDESKFTVETFFDLKQIGLKHLSEIVTDMRAFLQGQIYGAPLSTEGNLIFEDAIKTVPIMQLRKELKKYGFKPWQIKTRIYANQIRVVILYADIEKNTDIIVNELRLLGWNKARISEPIIIGKIPYRIMDFDPNEEKSRTKSAKMFQYFYHWTPMKNVQSILKNGLEPKNENDYFSYPPRIHLLKWIIDETYTLFFGWQLYCHNKNITYGKYALLKISRDKLPEDIDFYGDPRFEDGYYVKETIPAEAISIYGYAEFKDKENFNKEEIKFEKLS